MTLKERIELLTKKRENQRDLYLKCQGAIEILTEMLNEEKEKKRDGK